MKTVIGPKTAALLYGLLAAAALILMHGKALIIALIIVLGLAAKSWVDYLKRRLE